MKHWIELTDEYTEKIKNGAFRKIRFLYGQEVTCVWSKVKNRFLYPGTGHDLYRNDNHPTHVLVGSPATKDEIRLLTENAALRLRLDKARKALKQYAAIPDIGGPAEKLLDELDKE